MMLKHLMAVSAVSGVLLAAPPPAQANFVYDYNFNLEGGLGEVTGTISFASITGCLIAPHYCIATSATVLTAPADTIAHFGTYSNIDFNEFVIDGMGDITYVAFDDTDDFGDDLGIAIILEPHDSVINGYLFGPDYSEDPISFTAATPLPAALPLFAGGLGALGLLGWRRKRKDRTAIAA